MMEKWNCGLKFRMRRVTHNAGIVASDNAFQRRQQSRHPPWSGEWRNTRQTRAAHRHAAATVSRVKRYAFK